MVRQRSDKQIVKKISSMVTSLNQNDSSVETCLQKKRKELSEKSDFQYYTPESKCGDSFDDYIPSIHDIGSDDSFVQEDNVSEMILSVHDEEYQTQTATKVLFYGKIDQDKIDLEGLQKGKWNNDNIPKNTPLFKGSTLTVLLFVIRVATLYDKCEMSKASLAFVLEFIEELLCDIPERWKFPNNPDEFLNLVATFDFKEHKYCNECKKEIDVKEVNCLTCGHKLRKFFTYSIEKWFSEMASLIGEKQWLKLLSKGLSVHHSHEIHDFVDGDEYDRIQKYFPFDNSIMNDIVLYFMLSTDGGNRFRSSSRSFWPFELFCFNLPGSVRYSLDFTAIIAFSDHKPVMSVILRHIVDNFLSLMTRQAVKLNTEVIYLRSALAVVTTDRMAHFDIAGTVHPQSFYSCNICNQSGVSISNRMVFPLSEKEDTSSRTFRTKEEWKESVQKAQSYAKPTPVQGISFESLLCELPYVDITKLFSSEVMHDFMLGFLKKVLKRVKIKVGNTLWNDFQQQYLKQNIPTIFHTRTRKFIFTKGTNEVTRVKALELWNLFIYMYPLFKEYTTEITYTNYTGNTSTLYDYLVRIAMLGNWFMNPILRKDLENLRYLIYSVLYDTTTLFGNEVLTLVSHRIGHYPHLIQWHGPIFIISAFPMERSISHFMNAITGTFNIEKKSLHGILVKQRVMYYRRVTGVLKNHFGIGSSVFVYSPNYGYAFLCETLKGYMLYTCDNVFIGQAQTKSKIFLQNIDESFVPCFTLVINETTVLIPLHYTIKYFL